MADLPCTIGDMVAVNDIARSWGIAFSSDAMGKVLLRNDSESKRYIVLFRELTLYYFEELAANRISLRYFLLLLGRQTLTTIAHVIRYR